MANNKRSWVDLLGEYFREISVLVLVFGFLETYENGDLTDGMICLILSIALVTLVVGILIEVFRK